MTVCTQHVSNTSAKLENSKASKCGNDVQVTQWKLHEILSEVYLMMSGRKNVSLLDTRKKEHYVTVGTNQ